MRGHWIGGTRKLNKHWQSGGGSAEFSRWFTTIKYDDDYYCFAPSYQFTDLPKIEYLTHAIGGSLVQAVKNTVVPFGNVTLMPSFNNNMNVAISYTLEDMRENATIFTRTLSPSDRVKVIIPTFKASLYIEDGTVVNPTTYASVYGYKYTSNPILPAGAEILWQDNADLQSYESRYADDLNIVRNTWNAWQAYWITPWTNMDIYDESDILLDTPVYKHCDIRMGYYDHNRSDAIAVNLLSPIMQQLYKGQTDNGLLPFNNVNLYYGQTHDYSEGKNYNVWINLELVSLSLQERVIV